MIRKKIFLRIAIVVCVFLSIRTNSSQTIPFFDDLENDPTLFAMNDDMVDGFSDLLISDSEQMGRIEQCLVTPTCTCFDVLSALLPLGIGPLLAEDVYLHTYPLVVRSLLDNPLFLPLRAYNRPHVLGLDLFYNQMSRARFHGTSSALCSYLALSEQTLLDKLASIFDLAQEKLMLDIPAQFNPLDFLPLFKNITVEERRAGSMFYGNFYHKDFTFTFNVPFYYLEHNFIMTPAEQEAIELVLGSANEADSQQFAKEHLICDKIGFGDTRLYFSYSPEFLHNFGMTVGGLLTVPTSFLFAKGLMGASFPQSCTRPNFNLGDVVCQFIAGDDKDKTRALQEVQEFALGSLDRLSSILLEAPLGNHRHVGIGIFIKTNLPLQAIIKRPWVRHFSWQGFYSAEYLTPGKERRSFIAGCLAQEIEELGFNKTGQDLEELLQKLENDPDLAKQLLDFINIRVIDIFYPFAFTTRVWPGFVFRSTSRLIYEGQRWGFFLGSDFWAQGKEHITIPCYPCPGGLNSKKATRPIAYQSKMFGSIFYKVLRDTKDWTLGISLEDTTMFSSSIGESFTLALIFDAAF